MTLIGSDEEPVRRLGPDAQLGRVTGRAPARLHEQRVVEQRILRADGEHRRRHPGEVGEQGRDVGIAPLLGVAPGQELLEVPGDDRG